LVPIASIDKVNILITDSKADKKLLKAFEDKVIKVLVGEVKEVDL
jgi:DeoR/GlpR family transcriptional regulator of sugar metabolism